jgi:UDP-galactopyranose mutase
VDTRQPDLVCISHLWWDWVWQRPQQLMSRLARHYRVFWAEEPHIEIGPAGESFEVAEERPNLQVGRLLYRSDAATFRRRLGEVLERSGVPDFKVSDELTEATLMFGSPEQERLEREVRDYVAARRRGPLVLWLYTPAVVDFINLLEPDLVVYDVMDELTAFNFAPPRLREQERELLARADLVFCGGPSLYEGRKGRHPQVHLFPSGVEQAHFARALDDDLPAPDALRALPRPVIGFSGVIDERLDLDLLAKAAVARPNWSWVMVGPVVKIEEEALPRLPNIHYAGKQDYGRLPAYLKAFDVAMMPFARNEATRFISPTKTLEYMAAHKPIVSTPIHDVVGLYGAVVRIAEGPEAFVAQVEGALAEGEGERARRRQQEDELLQRYAWDRIAGDMHALIEQALAGKAPPHLVGD